MFGLLISGTVFPLTDDFFLLRLILSDCLLVMLIMPLLNAATTNMALKMMFSRLD
jgi:hypothetical protein